jgi:hypothetical protein
MPRPSRPSVDPRETLDLRLHELENQVDQRLYDGSWERMTAVASQYVRLGEQALAQGQLGEAQFYVERAKSILGIKDQASEE